MIQADLLRVFCIYFAVEANRAGNSTEQSLLLSSLLFRYLSRSRNNLSAAALHQEWTKIAEAVANEEITALLCEKLVECCSSYSLFSDFLDRSLKRVFEDSTTTANGSGLKGPSRISENSFLGVLVRSVLARWQCYEFDQQCRCYLEFSSFLDTITNQEEPLCIDEQYKSALSSSAAVDNPFEKLCMQGQFEEAEVWIHQYFDHRHSSTTDPNTSTDPVDLVLGLEYTNSSISAADGEKRVDQRIMLAIAVLRIRAGDMTRARLAVDEALKVAHQSGDNESVAHCLLLLFHIVERGGNGTNATSIDSEDLLRRCIIRAAALKLPTLVAEAGLSYATVKLREALGADHQRPDISDAWSLPRILRFLSLCELGESHRIKEALSHDEQFSGNVSLPLSTNHMMGLQRMVGGGITSSTTLGDKSSYLDPHNKQYPFFAIKVAVVKAEVFAAQGEFKAAVMTCQRAMQSYASTVDMKSFLAQYVVHIQVNHFLSEHIANDENEAEIEESFLTNHITSYRRLLSSSGTVEVNGNASLYSKQVLEVITFFLAALCAAVKRDWSRSLRMIEHCVEWSQQCAANHPHAIIALLMRNRQRFKVVQVILRGKQAKQEEEVIRKQLSVSIDNADGGNNLVRSPLSRWLLKL